MKTVSRKMQSLNTQQNEECSCLGGYKAQNQYFLSKNRKKDGSHYVSGQKKQENSCESIKIGSHKKSLRKVAGVSPASKKQTSTFLQYYSPEPVEKKIQEKDYYQLKEYRQVEPKCVQPKINFCFKNQDYQGLNKKSGLNKILSQPHLVHQNYHHQVISEVPAHFSPPSHAYTNQVKPKVHFKHEYSPPQNYHHFGYKSGAFGTPEMSNKGQMRTQPQTRDYIQSELHLDLPQSRLQTQQRRQRILKSQYKQDNNPQQYLKVFDQRQKKSKSKSKKQKQIKSEQHIKQLNDFDTYHSRVNPKKSLVSKQVLRSKINNKKNKDNPNRLIRKMTDVQEIKSLVDSEENNSDDDKVSVVLGRLKEYGSFVDPSQSEKQSKLGYQSTSIGKSHLRTFDSNFR